MEKQYKGKLTDAIIRDFNMNDLEKYEIKEIQPRVLINSKRIDIIAKLKYIENIDKQLNCKFYYTLYKRHIDAFTNGTFIEWGNEEKNSINKYVKTFDELIKSIKKGGFDDSISLVPVGNDNVILDGAHRTSVAIYYNKPLKVITLKNRTVDFDVNYFEKKLLSKKYIDYLMTEYCKLKDDIYVFCIWPSTKEKEKIEKKIIEDTKVIYSKEADLTYNGCRNLMIQIYGKYDWAGNIQNHFKGLYTKLNECYKDNEKLKIFIIEENKEKLLQLQKEINKKYNISLNNLYITDNREETIGLVEVLLNKNSLDFLNSAKPDKYIDLYEKIQIYRNNIKKMKLNSDEFIIDSNSVLAVYGIKNEKKLSFLSYNKECKKIEDDNIKCNNINSDLYKKSIIELINNPDFYFYFWNVKFLNLKLIKRCKNNNINRMEKRAIRKILNKKDWKYNYRLLRTEFKRVKRNIIIEVKRRIENVLRNLHIIK